jgi:hypothetical protein
MSLKLVVSRIAAGIFTVGLLQNQLLSAAEPATAAPAAASENEFVDLLGGDAPKLWRGYLKEGWPEGWKLESGVLSREAGGDDIMTVATYGDFELRLEWKISPGGNSGIIYHSLPGDAKSYLTGLEYQILDNDVHPDGKKPKTSSGSLYALYAPEGAGPRPVGEWNEARIVVQGNHIEHWLGGKKVVDCELGSPDWQRRLAESKFADWPKFAKSPTGHVALQDHDAPVWYRKVEIRSLTAR